MARAMSRRTVLIRAVFVSWRVANWKRSLNISSCSSRKRCSGFAAGSVVFWRPRRAGALRRGCDFLSATLEALLDHEFGRHWQFVRCQAPRLLGEVLPDAADCEQHMARLDH